MDTAERVVLVDGQDRELGTMEKLAAHREGRLHRALSVFLFNARGQTLLQRRHGGKYHSGGLWSNTCCSHPRPGEAMADAARRRLREEMGIDCELVPAHAFVYRARVGPELTEHEYDHVFVGTTEEEPRPDPTEVAEWRWVGVDEVRAEAEREPERFTLWFREALDGVLASGAGPAAPASRG